MIVEKARREKRPALLLAPVTITPTKPLTPSHVKFLLWMDVLYRATAHLADVTYLYHHRTFALTQQVLRFWEYLDRNSGGADYGRMSEEEIGALYVRSHAQPWSPDIDLQRTYAERVERWGWFHPASARLLDLWEEQYRVIGLANPRLGRDGPPRLDTEDLVTRLRSRSLCLDLREWGGPVYLDASAYGIQIRQILDADGRPNYLMCALRELLPLIDCHDRFVLACDAELGPDYRLLARILTCFGARVSLLEVKRVPIDGVSRSARHGGWEGFTLGSLLRRFIPEYGEATFRLGLRLYLVAGLGKGTGQSFSFDHLRRQLDRAGRMRERTGSPGPGQHNLRDFLAGLVGAGGFVDPYRLTSSLLARHRRVPLPELLGGVYA